MADSRISGRRFSRIFKFFSKMVAALRSNCYPSNGAESQSKEIQLQQRELLDACRQGSLENVKKCLEKGVDVNTEGKNGHSVLMLASKCGHANLVKYLLSDSVAADINHSNKKKNNALIMSAWKGHSEVCDLLLRNNPAIDIEHSNNKSATALTLAAQYGQDHIVKRLLENDQPANIYHEIHNGKTALILASRLGHSKVVKLLLENNPPARVNHNNHNSYSALMLAAKFGHLDVVKMLVEHSESPDIHYEREGRSALDWAIARRNYDVAAYLAKIQQEIAFTGVAQSKISSRAPLELLNLVTDFTIANPSILSSKIKKCSHSNHPSHSNE